MIINMFSVESLDEAFGIQIGSINDLGFEAGWGRVQPGVQSNVHQHDETEFFVIVSGQGEVIVDNVSHAVSEGTVILFEPFESHVLKNTGNKDIVFYLQYFRDASRSAQSAMSTDRQSFNHRPQFVFSTPPTPNGDLHLGHLSGPYLGADVYVRYQKLLGNKAWHLTGSDDYQSYVIALAKKEGKSMEEIAEYYAVEILNTLNLLDINVDVYTVTNQSEGYHEGLRTFFKNVCDATEVEFGQSLALKEPDTDEYLYEVDVSGDCPNCGNKTNGNICEQCGHPNLVHNLVNARSNATGNQPELYSPSRYQVDLTKFSDHLFNHHRKGRVPARLRKLLNEVLASESTNIPITHFSDWGIRPEDDRCQDQVIWVWPEMSYGFLHGIQTLGKQVGENWNANQPQDDWKIVHFFGYDNSFYHNILYPVLYQCAFPDWSPDIDYHLNEFYLLESKKFSTSRKHAIWGKEVLNPKTVDSIRYYLSLTRPENERTNFQLAELKRTVKEVLIDQWQNWISDLFTRVNQEFDGIVPDAGVWTKEHSAFLAILNEHLLGVTNALNSDGFSLRLAAKRITDLFSTTINFSKIQNRLSNISYLYDEHRTAIALELAALKLLATVSAPIMPRFSGRLLNDLGLENIKQWPTAVELVEPGTRIAKQEQEYFSSSFEKTVKDDQSALAWLGETLLILIPKIKSDDLNGKSLKDMGMTSLVALTLQYQIHQKYKIDLKIEQLLSDYTIEQLAHEIQSIQAASNQTDVQEEVELCL